MSVSEIPEKDYKMEYNPDTGYVTFDFKTSENAELSVKEYRSERTIYDQVFSLSRLSDPTPIIEPEDPTQVLVSDNKTEKFKQIANEVLEE